MKRQSNIVASLMENFDIARNVLETSMNSEGSAMAEHAKWMESMEAKVNQFHAAWEGLSQAFMDDSFLKGLIDTGTDLLQTITKIIDTLGTIPTLAGAIGVALSFGNHGFFKTIEDQASASGLKIQSIFGGVASNIQAIFQKEKGIQFGDTFTRSLADDEAALRSYISDLRNGVDAQLAFEQTMRGSSAVAQDFANKLNVKSYSPEEQTAEIQKFIALQKQSQIALVAQDKSLANVRTILNEYNRGFAESDVTQEQFINSVGQSNKELGNYLKTASTGSATMGGYVGSLVKAKAATIGMKVATMALNTALNVGISMLMSVAFDLLGQLWNNISESFKSTEEKLKDVNESLQEISETVKTTISDFQSLKESSDDIIPRFVELARGVDSFGNNVSLTDGEYKEFLELNNKLAELFPEINGGMDSSGNYMLALSYNAETLSETLNGLVDQARQVANEDIVGKLPDAIQGVSDFDALNQRYIGEYKATIDAYNKALKEYNETGQINPDAWISLKDGIEEDSEFMSNLLEKFGGGLESTEGVDWEKLLNSEELRNRIAHYEAQIDELENKIKNKWNSLSTYISAWAQTDETFNTLDDELQNIVLQMLPNLDYGSIGLQTSQDIKDYVTDNIISVLQDESPLVQQSVKDLFAITPNSFDSISKYINTVKRSISDIAENSGFKPQNLEKWLGFDKIYEQYRREAQRVATLLGNEISVEDLLGLSPQDFERATNAVVNFGVSTKEELEDALKNNTFDKLFDFDVESTGLENITNALKEVNSATGLSAESISNLQDRYAELKEYNPVALFEYTASGIRLNTDEVYKLEAAYQKQNKELAKNKLEKLSKQYESLTEKISKATTAEQKAKLYSNRRSVLEEINNTAKLASSYDGLTSSYKKWIDAQSMGEEGDMYDDIAGSLEEIKKLYDDGLIGTNKFRAAVQLMSNADVSNMGADELANIFEEQYDRMNRYFTDSEDGYINFLSDIRDINSEWAGQNEDDTWWFDFDDEEVAEKLNLPVETIQSILKKIGDYGGDVTLESIYDEFQELGQEVQIANAALIEIGATDIKFNIDSDNVEDLTKQIDDAKTVLGELYDENGELKVEYDESTVKDAQLIITDLITKKQALSTPAIMSVDTNELNGDIGDAVSKIQEFIDEHNHIELDSALGLNTDEAEIRFQTLAGEIWSFDASLLVKFGIDPNSTYTPDTLYNTIASMSPEAVAELELNTDEIDQYHPPTFKPTATIKYREDLADVHNRFDANGYIHWKNGRIDGITVSPPSGNNGGNNSGAGSNNNSSSSEAIEQSSYSPKLLTVKEDKYYSIGKEVDFGIASRGGITPGRGNGGNSGGGSSGGSGGGSGGGSSGGSGGGSNNGDSASDRQTIDWIETALNRIGAAIQKLNNIATSTYKSLKTRLGATYDEIDKVNKEIALQQKAYDRYMQEAESVGLSDSLKKKVQNGTININGYSEKTAELIRQYQEWYEKALACGEAIDDLHDSLASLYEDNFNNIQSDYENQMSLINHTVNMYDNEIEKIKSRGLLVSTEYYANLQKAEKQNLALLKRELTDLQSSFDEAMASGEIEEGSEAWYGMLRSIQEVEEAIGDSELALIDYANTMRELEWSYFDFAQDRISQLTDEANFLIDLLGREDLFNENGQLTDAGMATVGLRAQNYDVYMAQADNYAQEILRLDKELANDPYNTTLIERREELLGLQREAIMNAEDERQAIVDLVEQGIQVELDALKGLIDAYTESLDNAKNLYDYQKKVRTQTEEIASLQKQLAAYANDTSAEARARVQRLQIDLEKAEEELAETEYEQYISDTKKLLSNMYDEYEAFLNQRLDNVDALIGDMFNSVNENSDAIRDTLHEVSEGVGYDITDQMQNIWKNGGDANSIVTTYGDNFLERFTSINNVLDNIFQSVNDMVDFTREVEYMFGDGNLKNGTRNMSVNGVEVGNKNLFDNTVNTSQSMLSTGWQNPFGYVPLNGVVNVGGLLSSLSTPNGFGNNTIGEINISIPIDHVEDYDDFVTHIQHDKQFEQLIQSMTIDRLAGGSPLAKNKYKW